MYVCPWVGCISKPCCLVCVRCMPHVLYPCVSHRSTVGCVKVWDQRQRKDPVATMEPAEGETRRDCWTVAFGENVKL